MTLKIKQAIEEIKKKALLGKKSNKSPMLQYDCFCDILTIIQDLTSEEIEIKRKSDKQCDKCGTPLVEIVDEVDSYYCPNLECESNNQQPDTEIEPALFRVHNGDLSLLQYIDGDATVWGGKRIYDKVKKENLSHTKWYSQEQFDMFKANRDKYEDILHEHDKNAMKVAQEIGVELEKLQSKNKKMREALVMLREMLDGKHGGWDRPTMIELLDKFLTQPESPEKEDENEKNT